MGIVNNVKEIANIIKKIDDVELYRKIIDLEGEIIELTQEKRNAENRIEQLEEFQKLTEEMEYKSPFWYKKGDETPFCPRCWEKDKNDIHLLVYSGNHFRCPQCNEKFMPGKDPKIRSAKFKIL